MVVTNQDYPTTAATYQAIIIALVAAGILSTGLVSIIYRRRQRRRLTRARESGMRMVILPDGRVFGVRDGEVAEEMTARGGEGGGGKEPGIWDALVAGQDEKLEARGGDSEGKSGTNESRWRFEPISLAFPSSQIPGKPNSIPNIPPSQDKAVELTVLIAMPSPHTTTQPHRDRSFPSPSSSSSSFGQSPNPDFLSLYHPDPDDDELPPVEIATTLVPISSSASDDDRRTLEALRDDASKRSGSDRVPTTAGGLRIERTDGFRRS